ncbi:hypothetical protein SISNIDRAFT_547120 [Sistotremastrum niveocremeum HHB9708]|uniref:Pre-rRNA processing protein n=1 Tax=Sistotremastrum niveocremeum HHB9708 TaxID=1314777 RepID=A0A164YLV1_9AGAM|nr:hypothetical protein SISNIDRAFT_547120 [Sistotremastrum niveocremeum HHB9708]
MSSTYTSHRPDKGKRRADPTEQTPLLYNSYDPTNTNTDSSSSSPPQLIHDVPSALPSRWAVFRTFLITLGICLSIFILFLIISANDAYSRMHTDPDEVLNNAIKWRIDKMKMINMTNEGVWIRVDGEIGVDGDWIVEYNWLGRWAIRRLGAVSVEPEEVIVRSTAISRDLGTIRPPSFNLSLDPTTPTLLSLPILISPLANASVLGQFLKESWRTSTIDLSVALDSIVIRGGRLSDPSWRGSLSLKQNYIVKPIIWNIPPMPFLPSPPEMPSLSSLVSVSNLSISPSLTASAVVDIPNPLHYLNTPPIDFLMSHQLQVAVALAVSNETLSLDGSLPVANATNAAFTVSSRAPNITVPVIGQIGPLNLTKSDNSSNLLSSFLQNYLSGENSPILLVPSIPPSLFPNSTDVIIPFSFPGPSPKPQVLRDVHISQMSIKLKGVVVTKGQVYASGKVEAKVVLPRGMHMDIDVMRVAVDALISDGQGTDDSGSISLSGVDGTISRLVDGSWPWPSRGNEKGTPANKGDESRTDDGDLDAPPSRPLPSPLPPRVFARIRPEKWLEASSEEVDGDDEDGTTVVVQSRFQDVPLEVLDGREGIFSGFVRKVLFKGSAVAGVEGVAGVGVTIPGLLGDADGDGQGELLELSGLPFEGSVEIGKNNL